ncbi:MAG: hypothetical protein ACYSSI_00255 [Planctomycetota bacterium]|jgi:hypothetical protein
MDEQFEQILEASTHSAEEVIAQLQADLDAAKRKEEAFLSTLAYCYDQTEMNTLPTLRLNRIKGHIEALGDRFKIDWGKVKR